jgi:hypothetical protein
MTETLCQAALKIVTSPENSKLLTEDSSQNEKKK